MSPAEQEFISIVVASIVVTLVWLLWFRNDDIG